MDTAEHFNSITDSHRKFGRLDAIQENPSSSTGEQVSDTDQKKVQLLPGVIVGKLSPKPGDILVLYLNKDCSCPPQDIAALLHSLRHYIRNKLPGVAILATHNQAGDFDLLKLTDEQLAQIGLCRKPKMREFT